MNAALIQAASDRSQKVLEAAYPAEIIINGQTLACATRGLQRATDALTQDGAAYSYTIAFRVRKELLPAVAVGTRVTWLGADYRVLDVPIIPSDPAWTLRCGSPNA